MGDTTLAHCDEEPWNQQPSLPPAKPSTTALHSVYVRVTRGIPIFSAPGVHAAFVYDVCGTSLAPQTCEDCAGVGLTEMWQEWEWADTKQQRYLVRRCFVLCEACGEALKGLPLGQRWHRSKKKAAVLARCIRALEAVGHHEAVTALRNLGEQGQ